MLVSTLEITKLYTLNKRIVWFVNSSVELLFPKKESEVLQQPEQQEV